MNQHSSTETSISSSVSADSVSRRAYEIWENEGRPEGCDLRHWLQAEQELAATRPNNETRSENAAPMPTAANPGTGSNPSPVQGARAAGAASRENKRGSANPFSTGKTSATNGSSQSAARRKPASAPVM